MGLPPDQARLVVEIARGHALELGANENYSVTRRFRELSTREQRLGLIECLFAVAAADQSISTTENHEIAIDIARIPEMIRGYDLVKETSWTAAADKGTELLAAFRARRDPE